MECGRGKAQWRHLDINTNYLGKINNILAAPNSKEAEL